MLHSPEKKPEIVAPGGSFSSAIAALQNGADAVYAGLDRFSARRFAVNLGQEQLRRVLGFARQHGKKVFITLNTIIRESELREIVLLLSDLSAIGVDGIIVQDLGLLEILSTSFPGLRIHASTQLAVHNSYGVKALAALGVRRVILARELGFEEISAIRQECPETELEVFVHGSLCYSFSGLCLASGILADRSGNRGECAQVCRSWFAAGNRPGYYFSCNDLVLGSNIRKLADIGIDAFKIEGRMKPPAYVQQVCRYYRSIIDRQTGGGRNTGDTAAAAAATDATAAAAGTDTGDSASLVFSRKPTTAFFFSRKGQDMINTRFPSHMGLELGKVIDVQGNGFSVTCSRDIEVRDGLLFFREPADAGGLPEPVQFGIREMRINTKPVFRAAAGETVRILHTQLPHPGQTVYQISSGSLRQTDINENCFPPCRVPVSIILRLFDDVAEADILLPGHRKIVFRTDIKTELSQKEFSLTERIYSEFRKPGDSFFYAADVVCENRTSFPENRIFIQPSVVRKIRQGVFSFIEEKYDELKRSDTDAILETNRQLLFEDTAADKRHTAGQEPRRSSLETGSSMIPFLDESRAPEIPDFYLHNGFYHAALAPALFSPEHVQKLMAGFVQQHPDKQFIIGLNNISHFIIADSLSNIPNLFFFADFFLYCANSASLGFLMKRLRKLLFVYYWIEGKKDDYEEIVHKCKESHGADISILRMIDDAFNPPLFVSRVCYLKHAQGNECSTCGKNSDVVITMGRKQFRVAVRNCITYLFREKKKQAGDIE